VERRVKERLVGAIVLMAAAIILIPAMLSGPREQGPPRKPATEEAALKTYTIDLSRPPGSATPAQTVTPQNATAASQIVPLPSTSPESPRQADPDGDSGSTAPPPSAQLPAAQPRPLSAQNEAPASSDEPIRESRIASKPPAAAASGSTPALASRSVAPTSRAWAVQLGSFSKESSAQKLVADLKASGHDAFIMPVKSGANTLYRVRVGPMTERSAADATLRKLKALAPGATVVSHPLDPHD